MPPVLLTNFFSNRVGKSYSFCQASTDVFDLTREIYSLFLVSQKERVRRNCLNFETDNNENLKDVRNFLSTRKK